MSTETEVELEPQNDVVDEVQDQNQNQVENENTEPAPKPVVEPVWKKKPEPVEGSIPYNRFREVNEERKTLAGRLEAAEAELTQIRARQQKLDSVKGPEEIKPEDYDDVNLYLRDLLNATKEQTKRELEQANLDRDRAKATKDHVDSIATTYQNNLAEAIKRDPEIAEVKRWFDENANLLQHRGSLVLELMQDENVGELMKDIAADDEIRLKFFQAPIADAIRMIHKMSARIDREARYAKREGDEDAPPRVPARTQPTPPPDIVATLHSSLPTVPRSAPGKTSKDPLRMSQSEYEKWRANGGGN
jgi:hypothetical protein